MFSNYQTNFYIRRDSENLLWSGLSVNIPNSKYNSYKLSTYIARQDDGSWRGERSDLIIFDKDKNMYSITGYYLEELYKTSAQNREAVYSANLSRLEDSYLNIEPVKILLNELLVKNIIDELKVKTEDSFGIKIF